jgi:hypothetical protein
MEQFEIVAVKRNSKGNLTNFKLNNGQELNYQQAVDMAQQGQLKSVDVYSRWGRQILRSEPDGDETNNFDNLPQF